jgi:uncharacterized protein YyaL (SSP411 family)
LTFSKIGLRDLFGTTLPRVEVREHRDAAVAWLERAQDATPDGGVSYGYSLRGGWRPSYVETTGYIAVTLYDLFRRFDREEHRDRATAMARWLLDVQLEDGSFGNDNVSPGTGIVFDTGQDLLGLERAFEETDDEVFAAAADRAANWLATRATDGSGRWTRHTYNGIPHVYNARVAWALLRSWSRAGNADWESVARANLDWAGSNEHEGWFDECAFTRDAVPFTHTVAYAIRGLWEAAAILDDDRYREVASRAADALIPHVDERGWLPGQVDGRTGFTTRYSCLTGNCQLAIVWAKMHLESEEERYRDAAVRALSYVMSCQDLRHRNPGVRGAIKGSQPVWGKYSPVTYPNWATKFFLDAVLLCEDWLT